MWWKVKQWDSTRSLRPQRPQLLMQYLCLLGHLDDAKLAEERHYGRIISFHPQKSLVRVEVAETVSLLPLLACKAPPMSRL